MCCYTRCCDLLQKNIKYSKKWMISSLNTKKYYKKGLTKVRNGVFSNLNGELWVAMGNSHVYGKISTYY